MWMEMEKSTEENCYLLQNVFRRQWKELVIQKKVTGHQVKKSTSMLLNHAFTEELVQGLFQRGTLSPTEISSSHSSSLHSKFKAFFILEFAELFQELFHSQNFHFFGEREEVGWVWMCLKYWFLQNYRRIFNKRRIFETSNCRSWLCRLFWDVQFYIQYNSGANRGKGLRLKFCFSDIEISVRFNKYDYISRIFEERQTVFDFEGNFSDMMVNVFLRFLLKRTIDGSWSEMAF